MPPQATMHAPSPQEQPRTPPLWTECGHTLLKILPCPNFVAGGKNHRHSIIVPEIHTHHAQRDIALKNVIKVT